MVAILFEIECDLKNHADSIIVADVSESSAFPEEEYLFDADSIFYVESVVERKEGDEDLISVRIKTSEKGREQAKGYIGDREKEMEYESPTIMLGILLKRLGRTDQSLRYFERLLQEPGEESASHIYNRMSGPLRATYQYDEALHCLNKAYELILQSDPPERVYQALILHNKGKNYMRKHENEAALHFFLAAKRF